MCEQQGCQRHAELYIYYFVGRKVFAKLLASTLHPGASAARRTLLFSELAIEGAVSAPTWLYAPTLHFIFALDCGWAASTTDPNCGHGRIRLCRVLPLSGICLHACQKTAGPMPASPCLIAISRLALAKVVTWASSGRAGGHGLCEAPRFQLVDSVPITSRARWSSPLSLARLCPLKPRGGTRADSHRNIDLGSALPLKIVA